MKITDWEKVVLVWVNALKLADEEISDVSQLHESDFFLNLISYLGKPVNDEQAKDSGAVLKAVRSVLEEEFRGFTIVDGHWDNHETTLVTSLLLLLSAFKCQNLRTPLYGLSGETQLVIQAFIQKFISIHKFTPLEQISRQLLVTSLTDLSTGDEDCASEIDMMDGEMTPPRRLLSPVKSMASPETQRLGHAKVKSLECQLELLSWDKEHLIEEIEVLKADVSDLRAKYEGKAAQALKLENELFLVKNSGFRLDNEHDTSNRCDPSTEIDLLKNDLETLNFRLCSCTSDLDREQSRNADLVAKLKKAEEENISLMEKCAEYDVKVLALQANIEDLEGVVASLKTTVKEQSELLSDSSFIASSPHPRDLSLNESAIMGETMANVVEIKYSELEDELEKVRDLLHQSETQTTELQQKLETKEKETEELLSRIREHEVEDWEKVSRLQSELSEKMADVEELREDNEYLTTSLAEKRKDMEHLQTDFIRLKRREEELTEELAVVKNVKTCECGRKRSEEVAGEGGSGNEELVQEISHLGSVLEGKQVRLEEATALVDKMKRELSERESEKDTLMTENRSLKTKLSSAQAKMSELVKDLADLVGGSSPCNSPYVLMSKVSSQMASLTSQVDHLTAANSRSEEEVVNLRREAATSLKTAERANDDVASLRDHSRGLESELENLRGQHRVRGTELLAVQQAVSMCEHEKAILQRRIDLLSIEAEKCVGLRGEVARLKSFVNNLEMELSGEKIEHKRLRDQVEMNEKLSVSFDSKLSALQTELKSQYDKELTRALDEYNEKISQLKRRMLKDKTHIKELSNELWETSDRYLLASQEADALRNQLRRTRTALELVATAKAPQKEEMIPQSNPNLWNSTEIEDEFDERVTVTRERWARRHSGGGSSLWDASGQWHIDPEDEAFGDTFLEDLKAGIVRLPSQPASLASRASCPPIKSNDSSREGERFAHDKQSLLPPEKPKRKGQVAYCRPGPPTPSRNARLSLQSLDRVSHLREPHHERRESSSQPNRLSRLFSTISSKTKTATLPADAPAQPHTKRKGFFRKFGASRENIPPPWH